LGVHGLALIDHRENRAHRSRHAVGAALCLGSQIGTDAVLHEDVAGKAAFGHEPAPRRSTVRSPEALGALVDVAVESFRIAAPGGWK
jgi:hypothetical protein